jgi:hypothetical protein
MRATGGRNKALIIQSRAIPNFCRERWDFTQVDGAPHHPRKASRELDTVDLRDSIVATYGGKEALWAEPERLCWLPRDGSNKVPGELSRFSQRELRSGRCRFPIECIDRYGTIPKGP